MLQNDVAGMRTVLNMAEDNGDMQKKAGADFWVRPGFVMQCAEAIKYGDLLAIDANGKVEPCDSDDAEHGRLIAAASGATDEYIPCYWMAVIDGYTSGTEAAALYPSGTPGSVTETADTDSGDSNEIVGYVMTETMIMLLPGVRADSTA